MDVWSTRKQNASSPGCHWHGSIKKEIEKKKKEKTCTYFNGHWMNDCKVYSNLTRYMDFLVHTTTPPPHFTTFFIQKYLLRAMFKTLSKKKAAHNSLLMCCWIGLYFTPVFQSSLRKRIHYHHHAQVLQDFLPKCL